MAHAAAHPERHVYGDEHPPAVISSSKMDWSLMGMIFFICSETALFCSFFMAYFFTRFVQQADYSSWAAEMLHAVPIELATYNSLILFSSSVTVHWAEIALRKNARGWLKLWLASTLVLGLTFLSIQIYEYANLVGHEEIGPSTNAYSSVFFSLTGLHGTHVLVGAILLSILLLRTIRGHYGPQHDQHRGFTVMSTYWHFVDLVWIFVFGLIYIPGNWEHLNKLVFFGGIAVVLFLMFVAPNIIGKGNPEHVEGDDTH